MIRFLLPPNLAAAAARDAIAIRVEWDRGVDPPADLLPALALLQRWSASPVPPTMLQLSRRQLRELAGLLQGKPVFRYLRNPEAPLDWDGPLPVPLVSLLAEPDAPVPPPAAVAVRRAVQNPPPGAAGLKVDGSEHYLSIELPSRDHPSYGAAVDLLKRHGFLLEPSNRRWWLRDRHKTLNFLAREGEILRRDFGAVFSENFLRRTSHLQPATVEADVQEEGGDYRIGLQVRAGAASTASVDAALTSNRGYVESDGNIFLLTEETVRRLTEVQRRLAAGPAISPVARLSRRVSAPAAAEYEGLLEAVAPGFQPPESWRNRSRSLRNLSTLTPAPLAPELDARLRPYQRLGTAWLWHLHRLGLGGILADEMGLGKTIQALALLAAHFRTDGRRAGPALVVAPASLLENWRREAFAHVPELRLQLHHGMDRLPPTESTRRADVLLTSYGTLARDRDLFAGLDFSLLIADEAQHLRNRRTRNAATLRSVRAPSRFLLTGTPVENSLDDLRSLFEIVLPGYLPRLPARLRGDERTWHDERLREQTAPYILRRTKVGVAPELPPKLEQNLWCELLPSQARLYRRTQEEFEARFRHLETAGAGEAQLRLAALTQLLRLRQICCDPRLVAAAAISASDPAESESSKFESLVELLSEAVDDGHRVLLFSQFARLLHLLHQELTDLGYPVCHLDGSMPVAERQREVDRFQRSPEIPIFLLSLKAGGVGLNLTGADIVVHFDPWWNPAAESQATDRAHRIGQTRPVTVYRLVAAGTVEESVLSLQDRKRALLADVFAASEEAASRLSLDDLKSLLR